MWSSWRGWGGVSVTMRLELGSDGDQGAVNVGGILAGILCAGLLVGAAAIGARYKRVELRDAVERWRAVAAARRGEDAASVASTVTAGTFKDEVRVPGSGPESGRGGGASAFASGVGHGAGAKAADADEEAAHGDAGAGTVWSTIAARFTVPVAGTPHPALYGPTFAGVSLAARKLKSDDDDAGGAIQVRVRGRDERAGVVVDADEGVDVEDIPSESCSPGSPVKQARRRSSLDAAAASLPGFPSGAGGPGAAHVRDSVAGSTGR